MQDVDDLLPRVFEFTELLVDKLGVTDVGASYPHTVTLHTSCHSLRSLHLGDQPPRLLRAVRGLELVRSAARRTSAAASAARSRSRTPTCRPPWPPTRCARCSRPAPRSARPADNSCLMQIGGASSRRGSGVRCLHLAEILAATDGAGGRPMIRVGDAATAPTFPTAARRGARQRAAAPQRPARHRRHPRQARACVVGETADWQAAARGGPPDQGARPRAISTPTSSSSRSAARAPAATCTGRATPTKPTAIVIDIIRVARRVARSSRSRP